MTEEKWEKRASDHPTPGQQLTILFMNIQKIVCW